MLVHFPNNATTDPFFIIYHIQSLAALHGARYLETMAAFLLDQGFPFDTDDEKNREDDLEVAAKATSPSRTKNALMLNSRNNGILRFEKLCENASSFILFASLESLPLQGLQSE